MVDYSNIPRDSRRVPIATKVQFKFDRFSGFISEYSSNITPTGLFIVTENPEPSGRILDLEFRLGDGFEIIKGQGEVVWTRTAPDGPTRPPGMGIRFIDLSSGSKELIYRIVDRFVAQGGTPFDLTGVGAGTAPAPAPAMTEPVLPPLSLEPDPFPDLEGDPGRETPGTVLPWSPFQKETPMSGGDVLPPLEPLDEIFRLEEVPSAPAPGLLIPPAPAASPLPSLVPLAPPVAPAAAVPPAATVQTVLPFPGSAAPSGGPRPGPAPAPFLIPAHDPFPPLDADLDLTQAGPTVVGFDEPIPDPPSYSSSTSIPAAAPAASAADDLFASYLPQPAAPPAAPQVRPLSTLAGGASVQQPPRAFPWVLVASLLVVAVAVFFLKDRVAGWIGLGGGGEEEVVNAGEQRLPLPRAAAPPPDATLHEEMGLTSDAASASTEPAEPEPSSPPVEAAAPPPVAAKAAPAPAPVQPAARPLPEVVQRKPAPAGPAVTAIERITFEEAPGGTAVILWGNGAMRAESYSQQALGAPPRALVKILGVRQPFSPKEIKVGTAEVKKIRVGYHESPGGNELHVVIDLAGARVRIARVEPDGQRLRITLQAQ